MARTAGSARAARTTRRAAGALAFGVLVLVPLAGCGSARAPSPVVYPTDEARGTLPVSRAAAAQAFATVMAADYPASSVDAARIRRVASAPLDGGRVLDLLALVAPSRGGLCTVAVVAARAVGGACALDATAAEPRRFTATGIRAIGASDGSLLFEAVLPRDAWSASLRYEDGRREEVGVIGAWSLALLRGDRLGDGHRPVEISAADRAGHVIATLQLEPGQFASSAG